MAQLQIAVVSPEQEVWSGEARMVLAKTLEGELGILAGHIPLLGVLVRGGVVRIRRGEGGDAGDSAGESAGDIAAAVDGGFLSMANDRVSILAEHAEFGEDVDVGEARSALERALSATDEEAESEADRQRARLRAAGQEP